MNPRFVEQFLIILLVATQATLCAIRTVSKNADAGGQYRTITDALKDAQESDEIVIKDNAVYTEQVTISKNRITLRSDNPYMSNNRPTIKYQDLTNVGPTTCEESKIEEKINFDKNGAVRVMRAQGVKIEGIIIDGGGAAQFAYPGIWNCQQPLFHGNAALTLWVAGDVIVRNCELQNAYFGINVKDRNEGGIFANANPADVAKWRVVPLSGFGKTGNHIFEYNRIHSNSWGIFFESTWDLASTVRYNLIYENHHTALLQTKIKTMPDGGNQPGGAIMFKDQMLSPIAIYNNTFWHNCLLIVAHWQVGAQMLVFNNIFGEPYTYWSKITDLNGAFMEMDKNLLNRVNNCLYASQKQAPETRSQTYQANAYDQKTNTSVEVKETVFGIQGIQLMDGITKLEIAGETIDLVLKLSSGDSIIHQRVDWTIQPGALITGGDATTPFPKDANVRWLETKFKSTDPTNSQFLTPDWDNPLMKKFIVDQGWPEAGIRDADGSIADIGAISHTGKRQETNAIIKATEPISITGTTATASFNISIVTGMLKNPTIKYVKWIDALKFDASAFGPIASVMLTKGKNIFDVTPSTTTLSEGNNRITFSVPARVKGVNPYAFLEMVVSGVNANGDTVTTNAGFLPYRDLAYKFLVKIYNQERTKELIEVRAGQIVTLYVVPQDSNGNVLKSVIDTAEATLGSSFTLYNDKMEKFTFPRNFSKEQTYQVIFTKVPPNGMLENVSVSGRFLVDSKDTIGNAIRGTSPGIKILPGDPDSVKFYDPASNGLKVVNPGSPETIVAKVYDKYGNLVNKEKPADVMLTSSKPEIGDVVPPSTMTSDDSGTVFFKVQVKGGKEKDTFPIVAKLVANSKIDNAKCVVGKPRDQFFIFYSDTVGGFNETAEIRGVSGERYPVTIRASTEKNGAIITERNTKFAIDFLGNTILSAYASKDDTLSIQQYQLTSGKAVVWITSTGNAVNNGQIAISATDDNSIISGIRNNIFFVQPTFKIKSAAYFADNGEGKVNRVEIYYEDTLKDNKSLPDSLELYWPVKKDANKRMVRDASSITIDPSNKKHITVSLSIPFEKNITGNSSTSQLGTIYWKNSLTPKSLSQQVNFNIADSVGPLLNSATLIERIGGTGNDTMYVTFTEPVLASSIAGTTLKVIKHNGTDIFDLTIKKAIQNGDTFKLEVENAGDKSPAGGDSLKINSAGSLADMLGNKAHNDNRPVVIHLKQIPAGIVSAAYFDKNADGIVDSLSIKFNKKVNANSCKVFARWESNPIKFKDTLDNTKITNGPDTNELSVDISNAFNTVPKDMTSGAMYVDVINKDFSGDEAKRSKAAEDRAAPVLVSATYSPGAIISSNENAADTLIMVFSEPVKDQSEMDLFNFKNNIASYNVIIDKVLYRSVNGSQFTYLIGDQEKEKFPANGDSVNMKVNMFSDLTNNVQQYENNKKVPLKVNPVPYMLITKIGPNPFKPGDGQRIIFSIQTKAKVIDIVNIEVKLTIYDQLGNVMKDTTAKIEKQSDLNLSWDGTNRKGRLAGAGTYIAIVKSTDLNPTNRVKAQKGSENFHIGVKR